MNIRISTYLLGNDSRIEIRQYPVFKNFDRIEVVIIKTLKLIASETRNDNG